MSRRLHSRRMPGSRRLQPVLQMSGLINWLHAGTIVESGGVVTNWGDASGQTDEYAQATPANRPLYVSSYLNGRPGVNFDTTSKFLTAVNNAKYNVGQGTFLFLFVGEWTGATGYRVFWGKGTNATSDHLRFMRESSETLLTYPAGNGSPFPNSPFTWPVTTPRVMGWGFDASANRAIYVSNGTISRILQFPTGVGSNSQTPRLNGDPGGNEVGTFKQIESAWYSRPGGSFSDAEIGNVVAGLRAKHGI